MTDPRRSSASPLARGLTATARRALRQGPPPSRPRPVTETLHGQTITDPFRWLEGDETGNPTPAVRAWTRAQNAHTRAVLDGLPGRAWWEGRLRRLMGLGAVSLPVVRGDRLFYTRRRGDQNQAVLCIREGLRGRERVLYDPNALDPSGLLALAYLVPSPDGDIVAFGTYTAGDEKVVLRFLDVASGAVAGETLCGKVSGVFWLPDGSGLLYSRLADVDNPYSRQIRFHRMGDDPAADPVVFEQLREGPLATTWGPYGILSRDGRWLTLGYYTGTRSNDLWLVDFAAWRKTGRLERREIITGSDSVTTGMVSHGRLLLQTTHEAPRGRIVTAPLATPGLAHWREVVPEHPRAVLEHFEVSHRHLVTVSVQDAVTRLGRHSLDGKALGEIPLPGPGSAEISLDEESDDAFVCFTSFGEPGTIERVRLTDLVRTPWERIRAPFDPARFETTQHRAVSRDGTPIPFFLLRRRGLKPDGGRPAIVYGYGGFNHSLTPAFDPTVIPWLERGGVYLIANLRGGGEYGDTWHLAGMGAHKENTFDDCAATAGWLIAEGWSHPGRMAVSGRSNGGLLAGAMLTRRPDLFRAAIVGVPLLDMLRYQRFLMARYWVPEYGSAEDPEQFAVLRRYSPYHQVLPRYPYPAVFLFSGEHDTRVHPCHARKMAALLQTVTGSPHAERPVLSWIDQDAGHGMGKPLHLRIRDQVDMRLFAAWQLGLPPGRPRVARRERRRS
ncbi:MAG: S9 family peptidase [Candidatus Riflebacteria bacterium]|nr:S9 family peptidase [Candidatus Riflebacteria bacterium]